MEGLITAGRGHPPLGAQQSPKTQPARIAVALYLTVDELDWIETQAHEARLSRSLWLRQQALKVYRR